MLFFTGSSRSARAVLSHQVNAIESDEAVVERMSRMADLAYEMRDLLLAGELDAFGLALHRGWEMKRGLSEHISTSVIDALYAQARGAGALGGKLAGAGGGGFLLLYCPRSAQARVRNALTGLQPLDFRLDWGGARIAFAQ
jgi:D-glycero-alpha-D-manno-heptose-7-phosphate kinase